MLLIFFIIFRISLIHARTTYILLIDFGRVKTRLRSLNYLLLVWSGALITILNDLQFRCMQFLWQPIKIIIIVAICIRSLLFLFDKSIVLINALLCILIWAFLHHFRCGSQFGYILTNFRSRWEDLDDIIFVVLKLVVLRVTTISALVRIRILFLWTIVQIHLEWITFQVMVVWSLVWTTVILLHIAALRMRLHRMAQNQVVDRRLD